MLVNSSDANKRLYAVQSDPQQLQPEGLAPKRTGEKRSTGSIIPSVYTELRALAAKKLATETPGQTLSATALVHEAYLVLGKSDEAQWDNKGHFYVAAAEAMRRILIGRARRRKAAKRGGGVRPVPLADDSINAPAAAVDEEEFIALDDALNRLALNHERKVQVVNLRYFAGLSIDETAEALEISPATAKRDWLFARAWLHRELSKGEG